MAELFHQNYSPVAGSVLLSALVASLPPILLAICLAVLRIAPWKSAIVGAASAFLLAWMVWGMPLGLTLAAATHGMAFGLWPICWIVFCSVMFYNLSVESGDFDVIRRSLARLTTDRRIQILLVAFCFGALIEGIAGFGAPVAITAAMLAGLGFEPIMAAVLALIANTAPVAFGSLGIPVTTLGGLLAPMLGHDTQTTTRALSAMVGRQLPFFSLIIPAYLIVLYAGWGRMMAVFPAVLVTGLSFAIGQFFVSNYVGPELTDTLAALFSLAAVSLLLKFWQPRDAYDDGTQAPVEIDGRSAEPRLARLRDLRDPDRDRPHRPGRQLRRDVAVAASGECHGLVALRPDRQSTLPRAVDRRAGLGRSAGVPLSGVGVQLAWRVPHR